MVTAEDVNGRDGDPACSALNGPPSGVRETPIPWRPSPALRLPVEAPPRAALEPCTGCGAIVLRPLGRSRLECPACGGRVAGAAS